MTDTELMQELRTNSELNPWLDVAEEWLHDVNAGKSRDCFIHPNDEKAVKHHNEAARKWCEKRKKDGDPKVLPEDFYLHSDLMPQPFIGNPQAPIWLLLENPGYSVADVYDLKSIKEGRKLLPEKTFRSLGQPEEELLKVRQLLVCNQLMFQFDNDKAFYELRPEFNTIEPQKKGKTLGGYNWYMKYLCCKSGYFGGCKDLPKTLSRNLFLLEYIPYHSVRFNDFDIEFAHHKMWYSMQLRKKSWLCGTSAYWNMLRILLIKMHFYLLNLNGELF